MTASGKVPRLGGGSQLPPIPDEAKRPGPLGGRRQWQLEAVNTPKPIVRWHWTSLPRHVAHEGWWRDPESGRTSHPKAQDLDQVHVRTRDQLRDAHQTKPTKPSGFGFKTKPTPHFIKIDIATVRKGIGSIQWAMLTRVAARDPTAKPIAFVGKEIPLAVDLFVGSNLALRQTRHQQEWLHNGTWSENGFGGPDHPPRRHVGPSTSVAMGRPAAT